MSADLTFPTATSPLAFNLNSEVDDFYRMHPTRKAEIFFIDTSQPRLLRGSENDREKYAPMLEKNEKLMQCVAESHDDGTCFMLPYDEYACVLLNSAKSQKGEALVLGNAPDEVANTYVLDHELGHYLCATGRDLKDLHKSERTADGYGGIRHFQRRGEAALPFLRDVFSLRAVELVFRNDDGAHFTSPVVEKIIQDGAESFSGLSGKQTVQKAEEYAENSPVDRNDALRLSERFRHFKNRLPGIAGGEDRALRRLARHIVETDCPEEVKWGAIAFRTLFTGKVPANGNYIRLDKQAWSAEIKGIAKRKKEITAKFHL